MLRTRTAFSGCSSGSSRSGDGGCSKSPLPVSCRARRRAREVHRHADPVSGAALLPTRRAGRRPAFPGRSRRRGRRRRRRRPRRARRRVPRRPRSRAPTRRSGANRSPGRVRLLRAVGEERGTRHPVDAVRDAAQITSTRYGQGRSIQGARARRRSPRRARSGRVRGGRAGRTSGRDRAQRPRSPPRSRNAALIPSAPQPSSSRPSGATTEIVPRRNAARRRAEAGHDLPNARGAAQGAQRLWLLGGCAAGVAQAQAPSRRPRRPRPRRRSGPTTDANPPSTGPEERAEDRRPMAMPISSPRRSLGAAAKPREAARPGERSPPLPEPRDVENPGALGEAERDARCHDDASPASTVVLTPARTASRPLGRAPTKPPSA